MATNKNVLITGASSGIGYELAKLFAMSGFNLIVVGRSAEELNQMAADFGQKYHSKVTVFQKDLFEPMAAEELYNEIQQKGFEINILVNDAGQGVYGKFADTNLQEELDIIQLNIGSMVVLTKLVVKEMVARGEGRILQLGSVVSKVSSPLMAVYAGTKAFVYNFSMSIINELKDTDVTMTILMPGATDTDFFHKAGATNTRIVQEGHLSDPAQVAKDGFEALMNGESRIVSGLRNKIQSVVANIIPDEALASQVRKMNEEAE